MISCARKLDSSVVGSSGRLALSAVLMMLVSACGTGAARATVAPTAPALSSPSPTAAASTGCTAVETAPTPAAGLVESSASDFAAIGAADAPVTLLFYCDLQSPECEIFNRALDELLRSHPSDLRVIQRLYPVPESAVPSLDKSVLAAQAAIAANDQGKFWALRDMLHAQYAEWTTLSKNEFRSWLLAKAASVGLDSARFGADLESTQTAAAADELYRAAHALGISSIPTVFVNGRLQERPALSYEGLDSTIGLIALGARQFRACPPFELDPLRKYTATLHTDKGDIVFALDPINAPLAVNSFVFLAQHGWFDGTSFHRVIPGFVAQGGDPSGTGRGGPGYYFLNEITATGRFDRPGVVGMANSGPDTNGSQFFITYAPRPELDGSYTVFAHVVQGMEVVESLTPRDPLTMANPAPGDQIMSVTVEIQ